MSCARVLGAVALAACVVTSLGLSQAVAQTAQEGKNLSALARENLQKPRPKPPFDMTGTWNFSPAANAKTGRHLFLPLPELTPAAQASVAKHQEYRAKGLEFRDDSGACWPLGVPRMMTRFWPIQIIQLPTMVQLTTMFNNDIRWIYTDGRGHPPADEMVFSYNGHSTGRWEGDALIVDTVGLIGDHRWIQEGIPGSDKLHVVERYRMIEAGKALEVEFKMTDPDNWKGEWVSTKRYDLNDRADIEEHGCIYEQESKLPSFKYNVRE